MPVTWTFHGRILRLCVSGLVTNQEIETAIRGALASAEFQPGMRLLWDARKTQTPVSADDMAWRFELLSSLGERGLFTRGALLLRPEQRQFLELGLMETEKVLRTIEASVFADEAEAINWLERRESARTS